MVLKVIKIFFEADKQCLVLTDGQFVINLLPLFSGNPSPT